MRIQVHVVVKACTLACIYACVHNINKYIVVKACTLACIYTCIFMYNVNAVNRKHNRNLAFVHLINKLIRIS